MPSNVASLLADDNDETFTDVSDLLADDEPAGEVNRIDIDTRDPNPMTTLERWTPGGEAAYLARLTPEQRGRFIREAMEGKNRTAADALLGFIHGGTMGAAKPIARQSARLQGESPGEATATFGDAQKRSPWAYGISQALGGLPAAMLLSRGGVVGGAMSGAVFGGLQGFLGSDAGANAKTFGEEFSGDNLSGKGMDAATGAGIGAVLGGGAPIIGKGVSKLLGMFAPKAGAAVASSADDVASRADDYLAQMDDVATTADDAVPPLDPVPEARPPTERWHGEAQIPAGTKKLSSADDVADEIFAKADPDAGTRKLGLARDPEIDIDTKQTPFRNFLKDEEGAVKIGMSKKDAFRKLMQESGIDDYDAKGKDALFEQWLGRKAQSSKQGAMARAQKNAAIEDLKAQIEALSARAKPGPGPGPKPEPFDGGHFDEINNELGGRKVSGGLEAFVRLAKGAETWEELETVIRKMQGVPGLERLRMPDHIQDQILDDAFRAQADAFESADTVANAVKPPPAKDPEFLRKSQELADMLGQEEFPKPPRGGDPKNPRSKFFTYGEPNEAKTVVDRAEQIADWDMGMDSAKARWSKDDSWVPPAKSAAPPVTAVEPPVAPSPQDPARDWYETFFPTRPPAQRAPMGTAEPIAIGDDFAAQLEAEIAGPQRARTPAGPKQPIDVPDMPQKIPEPISDELFAQEAAKVNALGGQKFAAAPPVMPSAPRPRPAPIEAPGFDAARASLGPPKSAAARPPLAPVIPNGVAGKVGRMVGRGAGAMVGGKLGAKAGGWLGEKMGERVGAAMTPEAMAQKLAADPAKLQQLASSGGPMAGAARFILQGMEEAGEAGLRARAFVAASMPSLRELFAPSDDRTAAQDR